MQEDFLHYLWKFQKFSTLNLCTTSGDPITVIDVGLHNHNSGPDFFNSKLDIAGQLWAGNVEIHLQSSDWYAHSHENDLAYENVIVHLVWEHDTDIFRKDNSPIPTVEMKNYVSSKMLSGYKKLFAQNGNWINCENQIGIIDNFLWDNWLEKIFLERLEKKSGLIFEELEKSNNHWEALLFKLMCRNFGLKVNGEAFYSLAQSMDFSVLKKVSQNQFDLESLLFGQSGLLDSQVMDGYYELLFNNYEFLRLKFDIPHKAAIIPKFFRLRPPNFPTLRLSQLASVFCERQNLFSQIISATKKKEFYSLFEVTASEYWNSHYNFGLSTEPRKKKLTKPFIDLLIINTIIPIKFCYSKMIGKDSTEEILTLALEISAEENSIVKKFRQLRSIADNSMHSQALLHLKNEYCDKLKCLQCAVGNSLLRE